MPLAEFLKLLEVKLFRHFPQRVVSRLRVTEATQDVNQPLLGVGHLNRKPRNQRYSRQRPATWAQVGPGSDSVQDQYEAVRSARG